MKRVLSIAVCFMIFTTSLFASQSSLFLTTTVASSNLLGFYSDAEGSNPQSVWTMDDEQKSATAYFVTSVNNATPVRFGVSLPSLARTEAPSGTLAYQTSISKVSTSEAVILVPDLGTLPNSSATSFVDFGTVSVNPGRQKGVYRFDFVVTDSDYSSALQGEYKATVTVKITNF